MAKNCHNDYLMKFSTDEQYPDLSQHNNHMSKALNKDIYNKLRGKSTPSGFTLDDCIQTGVDNPGKEACTNIHLALAMHYFILEQFSYTTTVIIWVTTTIHRY